MTVPEIRIITGFRAGIVRFFLRTTVFFIALSRFRNPVRAFLALQAVKRKRVLIHGSGKIKKFIRAGGRYFFMDNIPGWPSPAFNGYIRGEMARLMPRAGETAPLSTIFFAITSRCPMRCSHCFELENLSDSEYLSGDDLMTIAGKLKESGIRHFQLSGGEPANRFVDLVALTEFLSHGADVWVNTSGCGLTREKADRLRKAGLTGAEISLDHWNEVEHNRFRGNERSFGWARDAVTNCREAGLLTCLSGCATKSFVNEGNLREYISLAKNWNVNFIRLLEPRETASYKVDGNMLSYNQAALLEELYKRSLSGNCSPDFPLISYPYFHQRRTGCLGSGNRYMYIDPGGEVHACPFCRTADGNIMTEDIGKIISGLRGRGCPAYRTSKADSSIITQPLGEH